MKILRISLEILEKIEELLTRVFQKKKFKGFLKKALQEIPKKFSKNSWNYSRINSQNEFMEKFLGAFP